MTEEEADRLSRDNTYFGVLMVKAGDADGLVSGACHSTANTLRPGLQIVKAAPGVPLVSSCFFMVAPKGGNQYCKDGVFVYSDCGLNENPTSEQLAEIALISAKTAEKIAGIQPRVAMLSFSTKGSAKHADIDKVTAATALAKSKAPDLALDGELQLDAALVPSVAKSKAPGSKVAGSANVLIFPDLDAGQHRLQADRAPRRLPGDRPRLPGLRQAHQRPLARLQVGGHRRDRRHHRAADADVRRDAALDCRKGVRYMKILVVNAGSSSLKIPAVRHGHRDRHRQGRRRAHRHPRFRPQA